MKIYYFSYEIIIILGTLCLWFYVNFDKS